MNYCVHEKSWISILKERSVFRPRVAKFCENSTRKRKLGFSLLCHAYNYYINACVCTYRVTVEQIILLLKIVNQYFEKKRMFFGMPVQKFWWWFCENQGCQNFALASYFFKAYCQLHRLAFTWLDVMMDIRVSG